MTSEGDGLPASIRTVKDKSNGKLEIVFKLLGTSREVYTRVNSHFLPLNLTVLLFLLSLLTHSLFSSPLQLGMYNIDLIFYLECSYFNMLTLFT